MPLDSDETARNTKFEAEAEILKRQLIEKFTNDINNLQQQLQKSKHTDENQGVAPESVNEEKVSDSLDEVVLNDESSGWGKIKHVVKDEEKGQQQQQTGTSVMSRGVEQSEKRGSVNLFNITQKITKLVEDSEEFPSTIHGYTIFVSLTHHWSYAWTFFILSLLIVSCQLVILNTVAYNSLYLETCTVHTDCKVGQFCGNPNDMSRTYCYPCEGFDTLAIEYEYDPISQLYYKNSSGVITDEINCTSVDNSVPGWDQGVVDYKYIIFNNTVAPDRNQQLCFQHLLCRNANTISGTCDYFKINANLMTKGAMMTLIVSGVLGLAAGLLNEIKEARMEEKMLTFALKQHYLSLPLISRIPAQFTFIVTRVRTYFIPFITAWATAGLILSDKFSVENIALNILAISFIVDLDDNAALVLLSSNMRNDLNTFFNAIKQGSDSEDWKVPNFSILWNRAICLIPVIIMIVHVAGGHINCGYSFAYTYTSAAYICQLLHSVGIFFLAHRNFELLIIDLFRNCLAALYESLTSFIAEERGRYGYNLGVALSLSCICAVLLTTLIVLQLRRQS